MTAHIRIERDILRQITQVQVFHKFHPFGFALQSFEGFPSFVNGSIIIRQRPTPVRFIFINSGTALVMPFRTAIAHGKVTRIIRHRIFTGDPYTHITQTEILVRRYLVGDVP